MTTYNFNLLQARQVSNRQTKTGNVCIKVFSRIKAILYGKAEFQMIKKT